MMNKSRSRFAEKHPLGTVVDPVLSRAVQEHLSDGRITCEAAHGIATQLKVPARDVGTAIDLQEARICECQLGLFGHGAAHKAIKPAETVGLQLKRAIESVLVDGRLPCAQAFRIAESTGLARPAVAAACETLKIKISKCQLGAF